MNRALVDQVAAAVLYEGYLLYPYRPSVKNRQRWTFGGLYPRSYSEAQEGSEPWMSQTECLLSAGPDARLGARVRFLQLQARWTELPPAPSPAGEVWQEAVEREMEAGAFALADLVESPHVSEFRFPASREQGPEDGAAGVVVREQQAIAGSVEIAAECAAEGMYKVSVRVRNTTRFDPAGRDEALLRSLVSTHAILNVQGGAFVSMIDPPGPWRDLAAGCRNVGAWPVLVGEPGETDAVLSAPIILYDYPRIAPESPGDLFDATEIDEILTLRILTLTDDEKRAVSAVDHRARALLERTESIARDQLMGLHGTVRGLRPIEEG